MLHGFVEQIERLLTVLVLLLLGAAAVGGLLDDVGWRELVFVALVLLVVRPVAGLLGLAGSCGTRSERAAMSFLGVRGIGSVLLHGTTAGPVMARLDRQARTAHRSKAPGVPVF